MKDEYKRMALHQAYNMRVVDMVGKSRKDLKELEKDHVRKVLHPRSKDIVFKYDLHGDLLGWTFTDEKEEKVEVV